MNANKKTIAILGAGPTGSVLARYLVDSVYDVVMVARGNRFNQIKENGLKLTGVCELDAKPVGLCKNINELKEFDLTALFICTKTYSLPEILPELKNILKSHTQIISFQNGLGPEEDIANALPENGVGRAVLNLAGSIVDEQGTVSLGWFNAPNFIGDYQNMNLNELNLLVDNFNKTGLTTKLLEKEDLQKKAFVKTILNASLNPLCAITSLTMTEAMAAGLRPVVCQNLNECLKVGERLGYSFGAEIIMELQEYLKKGGDHYPSMWHDLEAKKPTEIDHINCKMVSLAAKFGISVPINLMLTSMVVAKEINLGVRNAKGVPREVFSLCAEKCGAKTKVSDKRKECYSFLESYARS